MFVVLFSGVAALEPPPSAATPSRLPKPRAEKVIPHSDVALSGRVPPAVDQPAARAATTWPAAGSAEVVLGGDKPAATGEPANSAERGARVPVARQAGSLPVRIAAPAIGRTPTARVELAQRSVVERAGVSGVLLAVRPTSGPIDSATITVDYSSFRHAGGADLGSRLRLVRLPECVLSTPHVPACQVQTPVESRNDGVAQSVSATVAVKTATVLAATAGSSGPGGAFTASSLGPSGSWGVTGATGAFTWSYPITLPPTASGTSAMPEVALSYNSAGVDGRTAATNNQGSWVGQGWDYAPGHIERTYRSCSDDTTLPQAQQTGDLCWAGHIVTMSLGGRATALIRNDADGTWRPASDDGARVELVSGGTPAGDHWRVTTRDGVKYHFGRNEGPGRTSQDTTGSRWTVPVYGPRSGDPCYNAAGFAQSKCDQVWRWNLDYVEDPHGNASLYYYTPETNFYGANTGTTGVQYTRGGTLKRIDYGLRLTSGSVYGSTPAQVVFDVAERCTPAGAITCAPAQFTAANAASWPDTPQDQQCLSSATCNNHSPSFWSTKRLTTITTKYDTGSGPVKVDSYALTQSFPTLTDPSLRLDQIVRTAWESGTTGTALPAVTFTSQVFDNRVSGYNNQPAMGHWRLTNVATETGGQVSVTYSPTECTSTTVPTDLPNNTKRCYPVYWRLPLNQNPTLDFFHVYPVTQVQVQDGNGISPTQQTGYTYLGTPAWHHDDNEVVKPANRTYGQFRGYGQVETRTGAGTDQRTLSKTTYFRGMHGDTLPGNQQRTATVTNSLGEVRNDDNVLAGSAHEVQTYLGAGGAQLRTSITETTDLATTATRARTGLPAATARIVAPTRTREITTLAAGGVRTSSATHRYDATGRKVSTTESADGVTDTCATTTYADNTTSWIRDRPAEVWQSTAACPTSGPATPPSPVVGAKRTYYDAATTLGAVPGVGNPTRTDSATANTGGTLTFQTTESATYDASGRILSKKDALNQQTTTAYTPALGGIVADVTTTNAKGQVSSVALEPARGAVVKGVEIGGRITEATYDSFGRLTALWKPGRSKTAGDLPNAKHSYLVRNNGPLAVTTQSLVDYGTGTNYVTSITLHDALGKPRQTQADDVSDPAGVSNRVVGEIFYDSHGWVIGSHNRYVTTGVPATTLITVPDASVDDRTTTAFDGAGRTVQSVSHQGPTAKATATTVHGGDRVTTLPPPGGVAKTTVVDPRGRTTEVREYSAPPTVSGNVVTGGTYRASTYEYNSVDQLTRTVDAAGNDWEYQYDFLGRQTGLTDPDAGQTTRGYDLLGQLTSVTDGRGQVLSYDYDAIGRRTAEYDGVGAGRTTLATWTYDTATGGLGKLASTTRVTANGNYQVGVSGYNAQGLPVNNVIGVPAYETGLNGFYTTTYSYTTTGQLSGAALPTKGGLPGEALTYVVNKYGNRSETRSNVWDYVSGSTHNAAGEATQYRLSSGNNAGTLDFERDARTHAVTGTALSVQAATPLVDDLRYTFDPAGNLTKIVNARPGGTRTQCFGYDPLNRLNEAWTATDNCAGQPSTAPGATTVGGPTPYWTSWTHNTIGLRTGETKHGIGAANTTTSYTYPAAGAARPHSLTSTATTGPAGTSGNTYAYDNGGNTTTRDINGAVHTLTWDKNNRLGQVQSPAGDTRYVYDADGKQLVRREPGKVVLYLPAQEFARDTATGTVTGTRYYEHNGTVVARRVGSANPEYLQSDHHGTAQVSVSGVGFALTRREFDPYGNPLGTGVGTWADNHGFLDKPTNPATGLTDVGARQYDSTTGRFLTVDPLLGLDDPRTWTGYAYAAGNPTTFTDPSGLYQECGPACFYEGPGWDTDPVKYQKINDDRRSRAEGSVRKYPNQTVVIKSPHGNYINGRKIPSGGPDLFALGQRFDDKTVEFAKKDSSAWLYFDGIWTERDVHELLVAICGPDEDFCGSGFLIDALAPRRAELPFSGNDRGWSVKPGAGGKHRTKFDLDDHTADQFTQLPSCNSFVAGTPVLLADGSTKPIEEVRVGDVVANSAPGGDGLEAHPVTDLHVTDKDTTYVTLTVANETGVGQVVVTDHHLFFDTDSRVWTRADELAAGSRLRTPRGTAVVAGARVHTMTTRTYDLTVEAVHTYYVLAGAAAVLVHNCRTITMDEALDLAADHVGDNPSVVRSGSGAVQFMKSYTDDRGRVITRIARFDVNPNSPHVRDLGPHLNLEIQVNRKPIAKTEYADPHYPIAASTIRQGDWWE
ncbi:RHS repeat-associated core domain-containing protein [Actinokineospora diospyrosa]